MNSKECWSRVNSPLYNNLKGRGVSVAENFCEVTPKIIYLFLSMTIVFLPLIAAVPSWSRIVPFYRKVSHAVNAICSRKQKEEEEFPSINGKGTKKLSVSCIKEGQKGFNELLNVIKANHEIRLKEVKRICLSWGDIPIRTPLMYSPNCVLFIADKETGEDGGVAETVIFDEFAALHPNDVRKILMDWTKSKVQTRLAIYTAIVAVFWVTTTTLIIWW